MFSGIWYKEHINIKKSMPEVSDKDLLSQLKNENNAAFEHVYDYCFPSIANYVKLNNGSGQDAEDIFQEAVMVLLNRIRQPDFILTSSLKTYLFAVSKNLWLKKLRSGRSVSFGNEHVSIEMQDQDDTEDNNEQKLSEWVNRITKYCQKLISALFYHNVPMDKLMLKMGWKNRHTAAQQKYKCLQQIEKLRAKENG